MASLIRRYERLLDRIQEAVNEGNSDDGYDTVCQIDSILEDRPVEPS